MVSRLKHENVVELVGYSVEGNLRLLAYEFATMGSLHDILHGRKRVKGAQPGPVLSCIYISGRTIVITIILYLLGLVIVTLSAAIPSLTPPPCAGNSCQPATAFQVLVFFSGLYLIAFGTGGIRAAMLPFGADQFNEENPIEMRKKASFFGLFYLCSMSGLLISGTLVVWV